MSAPLLIVGGGPAALATARGYREAGGDGPVLMLTADDRRPYRRPPLTKELLRGEVAERDLPIEPPRWYAEHGVEVRCGVTVTAVDPDRRAATTDAGERVGYGDCVLCTGSEVSVPPIPGADGPRVHPMRTARDGLRLARRAERGVRAAVVGAGFIGCEAAASLAMRGNAVTLLAPEALPQDERLGEEVGAFIAGWLRDAGVRLRLGTEVASIDEEGGDLVLRTASGDVRADLAVLGTGVAPHTGLAEAAGLSLQRGGVPVDASMRTEREGLWCAGDPAFAHNAAAGRRLRVEHWGEALNHGEVAGRALAGEAAEWASAPGFWSTIGRRTIKQVAWGDGWDEVRVSGGADGFTARYGRNGVLVGVLTHERDEDYERGRGLVERHATLA
jgi:3-phenylpropionate/trans-cinnamate dioxygenase ferredoxin reductase component